MMTIQLNIQGMRCSACVAHVEKEILRIPAVEQARVNLAREKAIVIYNPDETNPRQIIMAVGKAGYKATLVDREAGEDLIEKNKKNDLQKLKIRMQWAIALSLPLLIAMGTMILNMKALSFLHAAAFQLIPATVVQFWIAYPFYKGAWKSLRSGSPTMDVLVVLGTSSAYFFSIYNGFFNTITDSPQLYFEASAIIITLVLVGKYLEEGAKGKTSGAITKLMGLKVKNAFVERDGKDLEIPLEELVPGDIVLVKPGDRIPVDGTITEGISAVDESSITGESLPVEKSPGDRLTSGSVNSYGALRFKAEKVGKDAVLSRIIRIVEEAQSSKAPIQRLADKVAAVFVPVVLGVALLTLLIWTLGFSDPSRGLISAVAVLVIACPCALGLATPTAIMVGTGIAAGRGILVRNGEILEQAGKLNAMILDKTGTVTRGKPELKKIIPLMEKDDPESLLALAAGLEQSSEHPLARAICQAAFDNNLLVAKVQDFISVPGKGAKGRLAGKKYCIGTTDYLESEGLEISGDWNKEKKSLEETGHSVVVLASTHRVLALLPIADVIKDHSPEGVALLKGMGFFVSMITGDNRKTAEALAAEAGIDHVLAEVLPEGKAIEVKKLQDKGYRVGMAGDGINDAPALAVADTGIAMGDGSDIAMESGDMVLMGGDPREIAAAVALSRMTMKKIRQNLFWAFFYNSLGIPLAAFGLLNPIIAGGAMAFSSVSVISNSLSLRRFNALWSRKSTRLLDKGFSKSR